MNVASKSKSSKRTPATTLEAEIRRAVEAAPANLDEQIKASIAAIPNPPPTYIHQDIVAKVASNLSAVDALLCSLGYDPADIVHCSLLDLQEDLELFSDAARESDVDLHNPLYRMAYRVKAICAVRDALLKAGVAA